MAHQEKVLQEIRYMRGPLKLRSARPYPKRDTLFYIRNIIYSWRVSEGTGGREDSQDPWDREAQSEKRWHKTKRKKQKQNMNAIREYVSELKVWSEMCHLFLLKQGKPGGFGPPGMLGPPGRGIPGAKVRVYICRAKLGSLNWTAMSDCVLRWNAYEKRGQNFTWSLFDR